jgi:hypothetical protein
MRRGDRNEPYGSQTASAFAQAIAKILALVELTLVQLTLARLVLGQRLDAKRPG